MKTRPFLTLQALNHLLLQLEDVLQLSKSGLHLLQRELVLALRGLVLGNPGVQFGDGVVQEGPFLQQCVDLLNPFVCHGLNLVVPIHQSSNLIVSFLVCSHLLGRIRGRRQDFEVFQTGLLECVHLLVKGLDLVEVGGLGQTLSSGLLSTSQPGRVLLDSGPVLGPELDIVGVLVALNLGVSSKLGDVVSDPVQLVLEGLSVLVNLVT